MWLLQKLNGDQVFRLISQKHSYIVGRKNCDIILEEDSSISRRHATIYVEKKQENNSLVKATTIIRIVDDNSKYGIFVKSIKNTWEKLNTGEEKKIECNVVIRFGLMDNVWRLEYAPVIACTSGIKSDGKQQIANLLSIIDGELKNSWASDCNIIIVSEITLTVKVVLALINGIPIVKLDYLNELINAVKNQLPLPDHRAYRPVISETILDASQVSLDPNDTRKELFKNKFFIFSSAKQLETLKEVITAAGGKTKLYDFKNNDWNKFGDQRVVVIQLPSNKYNIPENIIKKFQELTEYLKINYQKRVIPESEIAQAIAYSSTEKFCNPINDVIDKKIIAEEKRNLGIILVEETPEMTDKNILEPCFVPCSGIGETQNDFLFKEHNDYKNQKRCYLPNTDEPQTKISKIEIKNIDAKFKQSSIANQGKTIVSKKTEKNIGSEEEKLASKKNLKITNYFKKEGAKDISEKLSFKNVSDASNVANTSVSAKIVVTEENSLPQDKSPKPMNTVSSEDSLNDKVVQNKRKLPDENVAREESKKIKLQSEIENINERNKSKKDFYSFTSVLSANENLILDKNLLSTKKTTQHEQFDLIEDFMELEKKEKFHSSSKHYEFNNSIYSVSLIPSFYLKEDGSLIEPPDTLRNVKKFKKQKIITFKEFSNYEQEDDLSGDGWLEVHPLNIGDESIDGKYAW